MASGSSVTVSAIKELVWGEIYTTVAVLANPAATTLLVVNNSGNTYNLPTIAAGMYVWFLEDFVEVPKLISVATPSGANMSLTIPALTNSQAVGKRVLIGLKPTKALILDGVKPKRNMGKWNSQPLNGLRGKAYGRHSGRRKTTLDIDMMLRPSVNAICIANAVGIDKWTTGSTPTSSTTSTAGGGIGQTTLTVTAIGTIAVNSIIQVGSGTSAECRKVTVVVGLVLTLDAAFLIAHVNGSTVAIVVAPFLHKPDTTVPDTYGLTFEKYLPYDDLSLAGLVTNRSYMYTGAKADSLSISSPTDMGIPLSISYVCQDKTMIQASAALALPFETEFTFDEEAVLYAGTQNVRVEQIKIDMKFNVKDRYTKNGTLRPFAIKQTAIEIAGSFQIFEDAPTQLQFWQAMEADTLASLDWKITENQTLYFMEWLMSKISIEDMDEGIKVDDLIDVPINFVATIDVGNSNTQLELFFSNADYLQY